jgi:crotonobetainyl-CoA:carnitine CoA-transferase CaiB-like acyl-CoA transferase
MNYLQELGLCDTATRDKDWIGYGALLASGEEPIQEYERVLALISDFLASRTKADLFKISLERGFLIAPIATVGEVLASPQLKSRGYWQLLEHPELGRSFPYPGPFARFSETPIGYHRRPPLVGEHNQEVYSGELGLSADRIQDLKRRGII